MKKKKALVAERDLPELLLTYLREVFKGDKAIEPGGYSFHVKFRFDGEDFFFKESMFFKVKDV